MNQQPADEFKKQIIMEFIENSFVEARDYKHRLLRDEVQEVTDEDGKVVDQIEKEDLSFIAGLSLAFGVTRDQAREILVEWKGTSPTYDFHKNL